MSDDDDDFAVTSIEVYCEGRKLQLRKDQLTVANLSKLSNICPDTIYLTSEDGFVALPNSDGRFPSLKAYRTWRAEGVAKTTTSKPLEGKSECSYNQEHIKSRTKWRPKFFPPRKQPVPPAEPIIQQVHNYIEESKGSMHEILMYCLHPVFTNYYAFDFIFSGRSLLRFVNRRRVTYSKRRSTP